jgi:hypothetical protein
MALTASLAKSLGILQEQHDIFTNMISDYRKRVIDNGGQRIIDARVYKPELWKAYNIALRQFVEYRFGELATIGVSDKWHDMKSRGWPVKVTGSGKRAITKNSNPGNADAFGVASDYLINQIFSALLSDKGVSPGFITVLEVASSSSFTFDWDIRMNHFYKIPFKGGKISYPQFLDDLLRGDIPYVNTKKNINLGSERNPAKYVAYGAHQIGLLGMSPAEREELNRAAWAAFSKIIGATVSLTRGNM